MEMNSNCICEAEWQVTMQVQQTCSIPCYGCYHRFGLMSVKKKKYVLIITIYVHDNII